MRPFISRFPELINSYSVSILEQYFLVYPEHCQTSKIEHFAKIVMGKKALVPFQAFHVFFDDFRVVNQLAQNWLMLNANFGWN